MQQIRSIRASRSWEVLICKSSEHGGISAIFDSRNRMMWAPIFSIFSKTGKRFEKKASQNWPSIKPGTWNIPEHFEIGEHRGTITILRVNIWLTMTVRLTFLSQEK